MQTSFFLITSTLASVAYAPRIAMINWRTFSIKELHRMIESGTTCKEIIQDFIDRIEKFEEDPRLGGVITTNDNAVDMAKELDRFYKETGVVIGPLHCVPILPKDNIDVADLPTTGGVNALRWSIPHQSADVVQSLLQKGAIVVGKANMSPLAQESAKTNSETGGLARNPFDLERTTYGSSGGNGASGAAVYSLVGLGTDTSGSVVLPAAACGLIGLRPTTGKLSSKGLIAGNHMQDTIGPMVRWAEDLAVVMDAIDPEVIESGVPRYNRREVLNPNGLRQMKVGVLMMMTFDSFWMEVNGGTFVYELKEEALTLVQNAIGNMRKAGAEIFNQTGVSLQTHGHIIMPMIMMPPKLAACKRRWYDEYFNNLGENKPVASFEQLKDSPALTEEMREGFQRAWDKQEECDENIEAFQAGKASFIAEIIEPLFQPDIDILIYPTVPTFPEKIMEAQEDGITGVILAPFSGYPTLTLPIGFSTPTEESKQGLPLGLTMMARPNGEDLLVKAAYAYQSLFGEVKLPHTVKEKVEDRLQALLWKNSLRMLSSVKSLADRLAALLSL